MNQTLEHLVQGIGMNDVPQAWLDHWQNYLTWKSTTGCFESFNSLHDEAVRLFDLPQDVMPQLLKLVTIICDNEQLSRLGSYWHYLIYHLPPGTGGFANNWPLPRHLLGDLAELFPLAVLVSGARHAREAYENLGIPTAIALETLAFGGLYTCDFYKRNGKWGLAELGWLKNHVHAKIFRLGRLVFNCGSFHWPFLVLKHKKTGQLLTLCDGDIRYRQDGLPNGTNNITEPDAWEPALKRSQNTVVGHPITPEGRVRREAVSIAPSEWVKVLTKGDRVVEVHIPSGSKLTESEWKKSLHEAKAFFAAYFPEEKIAAYTCRSWIMDPALSEILHRESNLVKFQRSFFPLPVTGDERQTYDLVFNDPQADLTQIHAETALQRAVVAYVGQGNRMRSSAGFMLWE